MLLAEVEELARRHQQQCRKKLELESAEEIKSAVAAIASLRDDRGTTGRHALEKFCDVFPFQTSCHINVYFSL